MKNGFHAIQYTTYKIIIKKKKLYGRDLQSKIFMVYLYPA